MPDDARQAEMQFPSAPAPAEDVPPRRPVPPGFKKPVARGLGTVQDEMLSTGVWVAQSAPEFDSRSTMLAWLRANLPYSSSATRDRIGSWMALWSYNEEGSFSLPRAVWGAYEDEALLRTILGAGWLLRMPPLLHLVIDEVAPLADGEILEWERIDSFIEHNAVGGNAEHNRKRIPRWLERLGFVRRERADGVKGGAKVMTVIEPHFDRTAFLLLLHAELAPAPRSVPVAEILAHPFWRCLGGRDPRQVRDALAAAAAADVIDRYVRVDQLEQATTRCTLAELLERRVRL